MKRPGFNPVDLATRDMAATCTFYEDILGLPRGESRGVTVPKREPARASINAVTCGVPPKDLLRKQRASEGALTA